MIEKICGKPNSMNDLFTDCNYTYTKDDKSVNTRVGQWDGQYKPNLELGRLAILKIPIDEQGNLIISGRELSLYMNALREVIPKQFSIIALPQDCDLEFVNVWDI